MYLLEDAQTRSITINYNRVNGLIKIGEDAYLAGLNWLNENEYWTYTKGSGRNNPATITVNVPEKSSRKPQNLQPEISASSPVVENQQPDNSGRMGGGSPVVPILPPDFSGSSPVVWGVVTGSVDVSHTGAIIDNQKKDLGLGRPAGAYSIPSNIVISTEEETNLVETFGPEKTNAVLQKVSTFKAKQKGQLRQSDYANAISWASKQYDSDLAKNPKPLPLPTPSDAVNRCATH